MQTEFLHYIEIKKTKGSNYKFYWKYYDPVIFFSLVFAKTDFHWKPVSLGRGTYINHMGRPWPHAQGAEDSTAQLSLPNKVQTHISLRANANDSTGKHTNQCMLRQEFKWIMDFTRTIRTISY